MGQQRNKKKETKKRNKESLEEMIQKVWVDNHSPKIYLSITTARTTTVVPQIQSPNNIIVGLFVRTLFDLYLNVKQYPIGSEIIFAPPISIPGMIDIVTYYNLVIRGVDIILPTQTQSSSATSSKSSTSSLDINLTINTKAILESI